MKKILLFAILILLSKNIHSQDGILDNGFGTAGKVSTVISTNAETKYEAAVQPDGKIVVVGDGFDPDQNFLVMRFNADGTPDNDFGTSGVLTLNIIESGLDDANAVVIQPDGKIIVAGFTHDINIGQRIVAVIRLNSDGSLDNTFDEDGIVTTNVIDSEFEDYRDDAQAVALQSDGKIVVAGNKYLDSFGADRGILLIRYQSNGLIDSTFGGDGIVVTNLTSARDEAYAVAVQNDGKIVVTGRTQNTNYDMVVLRYNNDGIPDDTFSSDGYDIIDFGSGDDAGYDLDIQTDNRIIVGGVARNTNNDFVIVRYNDDGTYDSNFGIGGTAFLDFNTTNDIGSSINLLQNGKIIMAGRSGSNFALTRFNDNGTTDTDFGALGKSTTSFFSQGFSADGRLISSVVQSDGKVILAGSLLDMDTFSTLIGLARFTGSSAPLPVELVSFNAFINGSFVTLTWQTATEVNNYRFEVERKGYSAESMAWEKIGFVNGNGSSNSVKEYSFVDKDVKQGSYLYRLKQIDNDGSFEYSETVEVSFTEPVSFNLSQNYPNPFNPTTNFRFRISEPGLVTLKIFDVLGKEISILLNEVKEPGTYEMEFNGSSLSSGVYYYTLTSGGFTATKKLLLLK